MRTIIMKAEDICKGNLILVNHAYGYRQQYSDLTRVGTWEGADILYESTAACALDKLMAKIGGTGRIVPVSAWRSMEEQQTIWDDSLAENGLEFTQKFVAVPGHSEHQTGLAIDLALSQPEIDFIRPYFPYNGICQTFRERAWAYGFVERYQEEKQSVTQIGHEPWHFRYVGTPHAEIMTRMGLALEEYIALIKQYCYGKNPLCYEAENGTAYAVTYLAANLKNNVCSKVDGRTAQEPVAVFEIDDTRQYCISGNNCDGFIVTQIC